MFMIYKQPNLFIIHHKIVTLQFLEKEILYQLVRALKYLIYNFIKGVEYLIIKIKMQVMQNVYTLHQNDFNIFV